MQGDWENDELRGVYAWWFASPPPSWRIFILLLVSVSMEIRGGWSCSCVVFVSFDTSSPYFLPSIERLNDYRCIYSGVFMHRRNALRKHWDFSHWDTHGRDISYRGSISSPLASEFLLGRGSFFNLLRLSRVFPLRPSEARISRKWSDRLGRLVIPPRSK